MKAWEEAKKVVESAVGEASEEAKESLDKAELALIGKLIASKVAFYEDINVVLGRSEEPEAVGELGE